MREACRGRSQDAVSTLTKEQCAMPRTRTDKDVLSLLRGTS